nr:reverse transcriptase domain-containing protein [Tanacetum cinerariifolium]
MLPAPIEGYEDAVVTTYLRNEITNFLQKPNETFNEAWECFKDLLRQCPHHGLSELHQLDTFYNAHNLNDQDALDSAAEGNFLDKIPCECLSIIESKSKVRYSRSRVTDIAASLEDKLDIRMNRFEKSLNDMKNSFITPTTPLKAKSGVEGGVNSTPKRRKLEDVVSVQDAIDIILMKTGPMFDFEAKISAKYGRANYEPSDRVMVAFGLGFWKDVSLSLLHEYRWNLLGPFVNTRKLTYKGNCVMTTC